MAFKPNEAFWTPHNFNYAQRCRCVLHSTPSNDVWVSTSWELKNPGLPSQVYEVTATASNKYYCADHLGATELKTITQQAWDNAAPQVTWDFFDPDNTQ